MVTYEDFFVYTEGGGGRGEGGGGRSVGGFWCVTMKLTLELAVNWLSVFKSNPTLSCLKSQHSDLSKAQIRTIQVGIQCTNH